MTQPARAVTPDVTRRGPYRPDLLTLARQARGLTQADLARASGISQATISRLEDNGMPSDEQVGRLAAVLDFPIEFFFQPDPVYGFGVGELFHRRRKTIPTRVLNAVHAEINIRRIAVSRLLRALDLPAPDLPVVDRDEGPMSPEDAARALRARWLLPAGPVRSVTEILARAGILVIPGRFESHQVDAIGLWPVQSPPLVFVNEDVSQDRLRLTLMHEVGHFVLHTGWGLVLGQEVEEEANRFAAEFLAPAKEISPQLRDLTLAKLGQLKRHWRISMGALLVRAKELGCITERRYQSLWTEMGKLGYRKREPREFDVTGERPGEALAEILRLHREELHYSTDDLARITVQTPRQFREMFLGAATGPRLVSSGTRN
ncbi:MAG: XRE family transcriptional regulator [Chloroflexota bacterium]|nr:XRE family transcriptional regulator [Chloroflexota bacterium]